MKEDRDALAAAHLLERIGQLLRADEQGEGLYPVHWTALRYIARANRFSRTPIALTRFLGMTRGTVSQTLIALERKGLIAREASLRDKRSLDVALTDAGRAALAQDPLAGLSEAIEAALGKKSGRLRDELSAVLAQLIERNGQRMFGQCRTCRHFRPKEGSSEASPHRCALLDADLSEANSQQICVEQEPA